MNRAFTAGSTPGSRRPTPTIKPMHSPDHHLPRPVWPMRPTSCDPWRHPRERSAGLQVHVRQTVRPGRSATRPDHRQHRRRSRRRPDLRPDRWSLSQTHPAQVLPAQQLDDAVVTTPFKRSPASSASRSTLYGHLDKSTAGGRPPATTGDENAERRISSEQPRPAGVNRLLSRVVWPPAVCGSPTRIRRRWTAPRTPAVIHAGCGSAPPRSMPTRRRISW